MAEAKLQIVAALVLWVVVVLVGGSKPMILALRKQHHTRLSSWADSLLSTSSLQADKLRFQHNVSLTVSMTVGSPPQPVTVVLDTGSELSWLHCKAQPWLIANSTFRFNSSRSYLRIPCSSPTCRFKTRDLTIPASCDDSKLCHVIVSYADSTSAEGTLAYETFRFGSVTRPATAFGCMDSETSSNPAEDSKATGLMGMNRGALSLVSQMGLKKFSYCISSMDASGVLILGNSSLPWLGPLRYTPLVHMDIPLPYFNRVAYSVRLQGINVNGQPLTLSAASFEPDHTGAGQTMVDSGTQFTFLMGTVYTALRNEFVTKTKGILRVLNEDDFVFQGAMDLCYLVPSSRNTLPQLPQVTMVFHGAQMNVAGEKLLYKVPGENRGNDSVWCFTFGNSDLIGDEAFVIGHHHQQDLWMEFDLESSRIGIAETRCDVAGLKLGVGR